MTDNVKLDDENVVCKRCGNPITESHTFHMQCECGCFKWEYKPEGDIFQKPNLDPEDAGE